MSIKALFGKKSSSALRDAIRANDLLAAEGLIRQASRIDLVDSLNPATAAAMTPAVAALLTGPGPALAAPGDTFGPRDISRGSVFFRLLDDLMIAGNLPAADAVLRRERGYFNSWHGQSVLQRIVESRLDEDQKLPLLKLVLADGHDKMHDPESVAMAGAVRQLKSVVALFADHGIGIISRRTPEPAHHFDGWGIG